MDERYRRARDAGRAGLHPHAGRQVGMDFTGSVVAIPGGTGGLGRAVTLSFLRAGATVVTTCLVPPEQDRLAQEAGEPCAPVRWVLGGVGGTGGGQRFREGIG